MARWIVLAALALWTCGLTVADDVCSEVAQPTGTDETTNEPIPREGYCYKYCHCTRDQCTLKTCGWFSTWFNPVSRECEIIGKNCDWFRETTTATPLTTRSSPGSTPTTDTDRCFHSSSQSPTVPPKKPSKCPPDVTNLLIPIPSDCSKYVVCNYGHPTKMSCPGDLLFRYDMQLCDWPECKDCSP